MKKVCSIIKWIIFIIVLILLVIGGGWEIPIPSEGLKSFANILHDYMNNNSEVSFSIIGMLLIIYCLPNAIEHFCNKAKTKNTVEKLEKEQNEGFDYLKKCSAKINKKIEKSKNQIEIDKEKTKKKIIINKANIKMALKDLRCVYEDNHRNYHLNNKKIYKIVSKTNAKECEAIDKLLNEFNSLD